MNDLTIYATTKSLNVICRKGLIEFDGCSIINDPKAFFNPIQKWISSYLKDPEVDTIINVKIDYIDSASSMHLFKILKSCEEGINENKTFHLNWYYDPLDSEVYELGKIFTTRINMPYNFISN